MAELKMYYLVDDNDFYTYQTVESGGVPTKYMIDIPVNKDLKYPKFDRLKKIWIEGRSIEELFKETKAKKIAQLKIDCYNATVAGFTSSIANANGIPYTFSFTERDQLNFNSQLNKINLWNSHLLRGKISLDTFNSKFPISWKALNVGVIQLSEDQFIKVIDEAERHLLANQQKYWVLEKKVLDAKTDSELNVIHWDMVL